MAEVNVAKLNAAFVKAFGPEKKALAPKAAQTQKIAGFADLNVFDDTVDTFCEAWPRVKPFLNMALKGLGWFFPSQVAMAKAVITAIDTELVPMICKP